MPESATASPRRSPLLSIPGSPDVQGEIVVEVASGTISVRLYLPPCVRLATTSVSA